MDGIGRHSVNGNSQKMNNSPPPPSHTASIHLAGFAAAAPSTSLAPLPAASVLVTAGVAGTAGTADAMESNIDNMNDINASAPTVKPLPSPTKKKRAPAAATGTASSNSSAPPTDATNASTAPAETTTTTAATMTTTTTSSSRKKTTKKGTSQSSSKMSENSDDADNGVVTPLPDIGPDFKPLSLSEIQTRLKALVEKLPRELPTVPDDYTNYHAGNDAIAAIHTATPSSTREECNQNIPPPTHPTPPAPPPPPLPFQFSDQHKQIRLFASSLQVTIEEFNLLLSLVSSATYKWGVDRSGASQQNLGVLSAELQQCQEVIGSVVSNRLSNVLCPSVDIVVGEVEIWRGVGGGAVTGGGSDGLGATNGPNGTGGDILGENIDDSTSPTNGKKRKLNHYSNNDIHTNSHERRINHYTRPLVDPNYVNLCYQILSRNAPMIRHVVASSIYSAQKVIGDYLKAAKKDVAHEDSGRGYAF